MLTRKGIIMSPDKAEDINNERKQEKTHEEVAMSAKNRLKRMEKSLGGDKERAEPVIFTAVVNKEVLDKGCPIITNIRTNPKVKTDLPFVIFCGPPPFCDRYEECLRR